MAILKHLVALLLVALIFPGCTSLPETNPAPQARKGIAWIERQFKICSDKDCPPPTRKTLVIVELPVARKKATPVVAAVPPAVSSVARSDEPVTATVLFEFGKDSPSVDGQMALKRIAAITANFQRIELEGRTDDIGSKSYNDSLARRRADFIHSWLLKHGVNTEIVVRAEGLCCYLDTAPTETVRRNNRRVEVRLVNRQDAVSNIKGAQ